MDFKEYCDNVLSDAKEFIDENIEYYDGWDEMQEALFLDDSVTGNASGSYYCNAAKAREAVSDAIFDDEAIAAVREFGFDHIPTENGPETCDVILRLVALDTVLYQLEEYYEDLQ